MKEYFRFLPFVLFGFVFLTSGCMKTVDDGEAGVKFVFGKISEQPLKAGLHFFVPVATRIESWNIKTQEIKERISVPTSEGLISTLDVSVLYNVPLENVTVVRETIGRNYADVVLKPNIRESIRNIVSGYEVKALFSDQQRNEISQRAFDRLSTKMSKKGVQIQDVLLRDISLPVTLQRSIEAKQKSEQESLQKQFELEKAKKDAEIEIVRAKGVAESNKIISESISEGYLRYLWIQGLNSGNSEVIYVPTEANLPIMEATRFSNE